MKSKGGMDVGTMRDDWHRFHKQAQTGDNDHQIESIYQFTTIMIILSALVLFCLGMWGCEAQEDSSTSLSEPIHHDRELFVSQPQSSNSSTLTKPLVMNNPSTLRIVAFGDSLTAGFGVAPDESYPAQLAKHIQENGLPYEVINAGVSGETSAGGVRRIEWILKSQPTVVILELGVNDGLRGLPLQQTYTNLQTIIERLKAEGVRVILAGMRIPVNYGEEYTGEFFEIYNRLAQEFKIPLIPFLLEGVAAQPGLNQGDGVHPTAEGYTIVTQNVWNTLEPILKEMGGTL